MHLRLPYALFAATLLNASAEVRLNELMASNTRAFPDIVDFEDYPDWFELSNSAETEASLKNYFLSDDPEDPLKWSFPSRASIPPNGHLIIIADGNDAAPGETHPRGYWPWRDFVTERYHTNFSLSSSGESLVLTRGSGEVAEEIFPWGSTWKYLDDGSAQAPEWTNRAFDDSGWNTGIAPLGYGDELATEVSFGGNPDQKHITTYFRRDFQIPNPAEICKLRIHFQVDDGCVIYLNGKEIVRHNMGFGTIDSETLADRDIHVFYEDDKHLYEVIPTELFTGRNTIAVEVHQASEESDDIRLDLKLEAILCETFETVDSITYGQQIRDIPLGRDPSNPDNWVQLAEATPGEANSSLVIPDLSLESGEVFMTPASGFFTEEQTISLSTDDGEIRYTLDGSNPTSSSTLFTAPFAINETTVIRARCFASGKVPGPVLNRTFFFGESADTLPYISLIADPETLFGDEIGIYRNIHESNRNVYKGKDAPGHLEFFPTGGGVGFQVNGGIRIGGENNWASHQQKALNFLLRGRYGDDAIHYDLFPRSGIPLFSAITLREGGDNYKKAMLRDSLWDYLADGNQLKVDTSRRRPVVAFLNGEYWGIYNLRERWDEQWFHQKYGIDDGNYDHLGYGHFTSRTTTLGAEHGSLEEWKDFLDNFLSVKDLTDPDNWAFVESRIDIDSYIDFVICESFGGNISWPHNREFWKERKPGAKWRWFVPDMDRTFQMRYFDSNILSSITGQSSVFPRLTTNETFRSRFVQRYAAHMASTFAPDRVADILDQIKPEIEAELPRYFDRWPDNTTRAGYDGAFDEMKSFTETRAARIFTRLQTHFSIPEPVEVDLIISGPGKVRLAGVNMIQGSGSLKLFPNILTEISAEAAPGFRFSHWSGISGSESTEMMITAPQTIVAYFVSDPSTPVSGTLSNNTTWTVAGSPYIITDDIFVPTGVTLTIEKGVSIQVASNRHLRVQGTLIINGTEDQQVRISGRFGRNWGGISFEEPTTTSTLKHLVIRNATRGKDPTIYPAAISGLNANLEMDFLDIAESRGPLFFRGGSMILRDSSLRIPITGDGLNVKQGQAQTIRCTFLGNNSPDTDAIDYDGVIDGLIKDCRIYRFLGFNSDGIDTGEQCVNVLIEGNKIFYNSDKGISVGQGSSIILRKNLIVGCLQGVGVKDTGSQILVDQNTFVDCAEGVSVFEKNFGAGGGAATVTNNIFANCDQPVKVDSLSALTSHYNLSNTEVISGTGNLFGSPVFVDSTQLNFSIAPGSPAIDSGDPSHELDPDGTRVDMGAAYLFNPDDYPFNDQPTVVVNEIFANSGDEGDWIELHNRSSEDIDISGWFLSDDGSNLFKYRIDEGTILPAGGYYVLYEDFNFGAASVDPNRITPFALSDTGETVHLTSATNNELTAYRFSEKFGPSFEGETQGFYYKPGTDSYNFVALDQPTLAHPNAAPRVGPIVISEIMSSPASDSASEYLELLNVSDAPVTLFDDSTGKAWKFGDGFDFSFSEITPVTLAPDERIILTRNRSAFESKFDLPDGVRVFEWFDGKLSNNGETIQLEQPGPVDESGAVHFVRIDRVKYDHSSPWPNGADGTGFSLAKISERAYGNDATNWQVVAPSPGTFSMAPDQFDDWSARFGNLEPFEDSDHDGHSNLAEYAMGTNPLIFNGDPLFSVNIDNRRVSLSLPIDVAKSDVDVLIERSADLENWSTMTLPPVSNLGGIQLNQQSFPRTRDEDYFRLRVRQKP